MRSLELQKARRTLSLDGLRGPKLTRNPRGPRRVRWLSPPAPPQGTYRLRVPACRVRYVPEAQGGLPPGCHVLHVLGNAYPPRAYRTVPYGPPLVITPGAGCASSSSRASSRATCAPTSSASSGRSTERAPRTRHSPVFVRSFVRSFVRLGGSVARDSDSGLTVTLSSVCGSGAHDARVRPRRLACAPSACARPGVENSQL